MAKMTKENGLSILRFILTAVGAYLVGSTFFGQEIDESGWEGIAGAILTLGSVIWGIIDKSATIEKVQSGLRSVIVVVGAYVVGAGAIKQEVLEAVIGIVTILVPMIYSQTSKEKSTQLEKGDITTQQLKTK